MFVKSLMSELVMTNVRGLTVDFRLSTVLGINNLPIVSIVAPFWGYLIIGS